MFTIWVNRKEYHPENLEELKMLIGTESMKFGKCIDCGDITNSHKNDVFVCSPECQGG